MLTLPLKAVLKLLDISESVHNGLNCNFWKTCCLSISHVSRVLGSQIIAFMASLTLFVTVVDVKMCGYTLIFVKVNVFLLWKGQGRTRKETDMDSNPYI
jgi:hypothetical protein